MQGCSGRGALGGGEAEGWSLELGSRLPGSNPYFNLPPCETWDPAPRPASGLRLESWHWEQCYRSPGPTALPLGEEGGR